MDEFFKSTATDISRSGDHVPSLKWTSEKVEVEAMQTFSCTSFNVPVLPPLSLYDVHEAFQVHYILSPPCHPM